MDLIKINDAEKLRICRSFFYGGFAFLPLLWLLNFCWFFKLAYRYDAFTEQKQIKKYVKFSGIGVICWIIILLVWNIIFHSYRANSSWGDNLSFTIPAGYA